MCSLTYSLNTVPEATHESSLPFTPQSKKVYSTVYSIINPCPIFKFSISMHSFCFMRRQKFDGSSKAPTYCAPYSNCSQFSQCISLLTNSGLCSQLLWLWQVFIHPNSTSHLTSAHMLPTVSVFIWSCQDQSCIHFSSLIHISMALFVHELLVHYLHSSYALVD